MNLNVRQEEADITHTSQSLPGFPFLLLHGFFSRRKLLTEGKVCFRGEERAHAETQGEHTRHKPIGQTYTKIFFRPLVNKPRIYYSSFPAKGK